MKNLSELENTIRYYNQAYREGEPVISDKEYDKLIDELMTTFPDSILLKKGVIEKPETRKEKLPIPMFSLDKRKNIDEINKWIKSKNLSKDTLVVITPKYDGISLVVDEKTKDCWTRGDGEIGQNSNGHYNIINKSENKVENKTETFFSFGEAIISRVNWNKYFEGKTDEHSGKPYTNPRNTVGGFLNREIVSKMLLYVDYIRYGSNLNEGKEYQLCDLNNLNIVKVPYKCVNLFEINEKLLNDLYYEWSKDYQIDGLVIDLNNSELRKSLGREINNNPSYAIAYKSPEWNSLAEVKVIGVTWQVSKQSKLKPIINVEPTEVAGVIISNVTGYNAKYIFDNYIAENSIINIIRSGDVIPKHIETLSHDTESVNKMILEINHCPCCQCTTYWDDNDIELICSNPLCEDKQIAKLVHFFSTLEIEEFGEPSIRRFCDYGYNTPMSILSLNKNDMQRIDGWGEKSAIKLRTQFDNLLNVGVPLAKIIDAYDVTEGKLGEKTIQLILNNLTVDQILGKESITVDELIKIKGVAEITANIFLKGMKLAYVLSTLPVKMSYCQTLKLKEMGTKFVNQKLCFTGCRPSKELESEINSEGGEVVSGVSSKTTILVVKDMGEKTLSSSKAIKAMELGVKIITIDNLITQ